MNATVREFREADVNAVRDVMEASRVVDRIPGFTRAEIGRALARMAADPAAALVAGGDGRVDGYLSLLGNDLTVHPERRRRGHGRRLVQAGLDLAARRGEPDLVLYVPLHLPASAAFATSLGFRYRSSLWQFELPAAATVPSAAFPADVTTRHWGPDIDLGSWVRFVEAAFAGHPTPVHLNPDIIRHVHSRPEFDPQGLLILSPTSSPSEPIGFARVEILREHGAGPVGYINMLGVLPEWRGRGLGRGLLRWGVGYTRSRGAGVVQLAVEADNERATRLYRAHGFVASIEWPNWTLPARPAG